MNSSGVAALAVSWCLLLSGICAAQAPPLIDAHMHTPGRVPAGLPICAGELDPNRGAVNPFRPDTILLRRCGTLLRSPRNTEALLERTLELYRRFNVVAAVGSDVRVEPVLDWQAKAGIPMLVGYSFVPGRVSVDSLRRLVQAGRVQVFGELALQYDGMSPNDTLLEAYLTLAEELDIPVGAHTGPGFPAGAVVASPKYRPSLGSPMLWEEPLARHPKLRLVIQHAGWPMLDEMLYLLFAFPNVYVDIGQIGSLLTRPDFYRYLKALVDAGFGKRVMWGSDGYIWPDFIELSINAVQEAPFLTPEQRRDIFYNNAVRFYRLDKLLGLTSSGT